MTLKEQLQRIAAKHGISYFELEEVGGVLHFRTPSPLDKDVQDALQEYAGTHLYFDVFRSKENQALKEKEREQIEFGHGEPGRAVPVLEEKRVTEDRRSALKFDSGKPQMGLISSKFLKGLAQVLTFGAKKYAAHNWRKGFTWSRPYDALQRHLNDFNDGHDLDEETGLPLLYHAACELMFLAELYEVRKDLDDRYKNEDELLRRNNVKYSNGEFNASSAPIFPPLKSEPIAKLAEVYGKGSINNTLDVEGEWVTVNLEGKDHAAFIPRALPGDLTRLPTSVSLRKA